MVYKRHFKFIHSYSSVAVNLIIFHYTFQCASFLWQWKPDSRLVVSCSHYFLCAAFGCARSLLRTHEVVVDKQGGYKATIMDSVVDE